MSGKQVINGKAFEYSFARKLFDVLSEKQPVELTQNTSLGVALRCYDQLTATEKDNLDRASFAAISSLERLEPLLFNPDDDVPLLITLQEDDKGKGGDVRDVIFLRKKHGWEIGISVKHNSAAVKHSRLSATIDFGEKWLGLPCSQEYFSTINPLFEELEALKSKGAKWSEIDKKAERFYVPLLEAFAKELRDLDAKNKGEVPARLLGYLLGIKDFYKVIAKEKERMTQIQAFSLYGTLNRQAGAVKPQIKLPSIKLASSFYEISMKPGSDNTLLVVMDNGWQLSLRIHSASTKVEPSLKFDVNLVGQPTFYTHHENWD